MVTGSVAVDSLKLFVPHTLIEGGGDVVEDLFRNLYLIHGKYDEDTDEIQIEKIRKRWSYQSKHETDSKISEERFRHGIWVRYKSQDFERPRKGHERVWKRGGHKKHRVAGLELRVSAKYLGAKYFEGIQLSNWRELVGEIERLLELKFKEDLLYARVLAVEIKGDIILGSKEDDRIESDLDGIAELFMDAKLEDAEIRWWSKFRNDRVIDEVTGNWGFQAGSRKRGGYFLQLYSKKKQYNNSYQHQVMFDSCGLDYDELKRVVRIEAGIHDAQRVRDTLCGDINKKTNFVYEVIREADNYRYMEILNDTVERYFDMEKLYNIIPETARELDERPQINVMRRVIDLNKRMLRKWSEYEERYSKDSDKEIQEYQKHKREFWSEESIKSYALRECEKEITEYCKYMGLTRTEAQAQIRGIRKNWHQAGDLMYQLEVRERYAEATRPNRISKRYMEKYEGKELRGNLIGLGAQFFDRDYVSEKRTWTKLLRKARYVFGQGKTKTSDGVSITAEDVMRDWGIDVTDIEYDEEKGEIRLVVK